MSKELTASVPTMQELCTFDCLTGFFRTLKTDRLRRWFFEKKVIKVCMPYFPFHLNKPNPALKNFATEVRKCVDMAFC